MLGQHQPVGARDLDPFFFQLADDRGEQRATLAHQHQDVSRARRAAVADRRTVRDPALHGAGDPLRQAHARARLLHLVERRVPTLDLALLVRFDHRPQFDHARRGRADRLMDRFLRQLGQSGKGLLAAEHRVDRLQHRRRGAERVAEPHVGEAHRGVLERGRVISLHPAELGGLGALEREDRLLLVADREHRAADLARARAGGELGGEALDDLPLPVARVLRLVDQHMVDAEVELVVHPLRARLGEQSERLVDQVVVVEQAAPGLLGAIARDHLVRDGDERGGALARLDRAAACDQAGQSRLLVRQALGERGMLSCQRRGHDRPSHLQLVGQEDRQVLANALAAARRHCAGEPVALFLVVGRALAAQRREGRPFGRRHDRPVHDGGVDLLLRLIRFHAQRARQAGDCRRDAAGMRDPRFEFLVPGDRFVDRFCEGGVRRNRDGDAERAAEIAVGPGGRLQQDAHAQPVDQLGAGALLQHLEARRDIRLERKLMQQPRAERMNGLHLQPARRVERLREQPPRTRALRRVRRAAFDLGNLVVELRVGERRPACQRLEHAVRHVGGRRLGVGEAEDLLRRRAAQQQADHALRQHVRLARARVGGDPGRGGRIGCGVLDA